VKEPSLPGHPAPLAFGGQGFAVAGVERFPAGLADRLGHQLVPAVVPQHQRRPVVAGQVLVAPAHQGEDDGIQVTAGIGQVVLEAGRMLAVLAPLENPGGHQGAEPGRVRCPAPAR
jgi:hypothetical protein